METPLPWWTLEVLELRHRGLPARVAVELLLTGDGELFLKMWSMDNETLASITQLPEPELTGRQPPI